MPEATKVRVKVTAEFDKDGNPITQIPIKLNDPYLKETVELNPDGKLSEKFAEELCKTYAKYKIITADEKIDEEDYVKIEDYREPEIAREVDKMAPKAKDIVYEFCKVLNKVSADEIESFGDELHSEFLKYYTGEPESVKKITPQEYIEKNDILTAGAIAEAAGILPMNAGNLLSRLEKNGYLEKHGDGNYTKTDELKQKLAKNAKDFWENL